MQGGWVITIQEKSGRVRLVEQGEHISADDPEFGDVHIVPCTQEGDYIMFGCHEFHRKCVCRPEVKIEEGERPVVMHQERKPN